jgi:hypothetical protein
MTVIENLNGKSATFNFGGSPYAGRRRPALEICERGRFQAGSLQLVEAAGFAVSNLDINHLVEMQFSHMLRTNKNISRRYIDSLDRQIHSRVAM